jgi:predicted dehydrogenase
MSAPVRIALVGTGDIGAVHAAALAGLPDTELCIVTGRDPDRAAMLAEQHGARQFPNYEAALADERVAGIDLCVPNDLHRIFAERAFAAGKHMICEKPIALTLEDADAMIAAAERAGRFLMIAHLLRFWAEYQQAHTLFTSGELGEPVSLSMRRLVPVLAATAGHAGWRHDPARSGGAVIDLIIHDLDFACWVLGPPASLVARGVRSSYGSWDHVVAVLGYEGGCQASIEGSFMLIGNPLTIDFCLLCRTQALSYSFDASAFALHDMATGSQDRTTEALVHHGLNRPAEVLLTQRPDAFEGAIRGELEHWVRCIRDDVPPATATGRDARLALNLALAVRKSCESGMPVNGPFV